MSKKTNLYLGKAGQFAVMSELLNRGWNVAIPEVDVGDDIFVVKDDNGDLSRVQVKASTATKRKQGYSVQFQIPRHQLQAETKIFFALIARIESRWLDLVIIPSAELRDHVDTYNAKSKSKSIGLTLSFIGDSVFCSRVHFSRFFLRNDFTYFKLIKH